MDPCSSQSATQEEKPVHRLADIIGTAIALLTLILPLWVIAQYSPKNVQIVQPITYPLQEVKN